MKLSKRMRERERERMEAAKPGFSLAASLFLLFLAIDHLSNKVGLGFAKFGNKIAF